MGRQSSRREQEADDEALCAAGVPIKIEDFGGKMHNKFMVIDANGASPRVVTGSMNWTGAGGDDNDENTLIIHDGETAAQYLAAYDELWNALGEHTLCAAGPAGNYVVFIPFVTTPVGVGITGIYYEGAGTNEPDEYVEIRNGAGAAVDLAGWWLRDEAGATFTFPGFLMQPGQTCRVYTNEMHPDSCGFSFGSGTAIWNNGGDCATLRDSGGSWWIRIAIRDIVHSTKVSLEGMRNTTEVNPKVGFLRNFCASS